MIKRCQSGPWLTFLLSSSSSHPSGGLLVSLPREQAAKFCAEMKSPSAGGQGSVGGAWIIGIVEKGDRRARIIDKPRIIEVPPRGSQVSNQENSPAPSPNLT